METLRLQNYRCFEDTGGIEIRPVTVLIGANSSGKSSFLKFFPLLKQSMGEFVNGAFLWLGPLVDMKDFNNTVRDGADEIIIEYTIDKLPIHSPISLQRPELAQVRITMYLSKKDDLFDYIHRVVVESEDLKLAISYGKDSRASISLNDILSDSFREDVTWSINNALVPKVYFSSQKRGPIDDESAEVRKMLTEKLKKVIGDDREIRAAMSPYSKNLFNKKIIIQRIQERLKKRDVNQIELNRIVNLYHYLYINRLIDSINLYFFHMAKKMTYVKPLRAIVQRDYRFQNYSVQQIDEEGQNLPMFFSSLSSDAFSNLNAWLDELFGFTLELQTDGGHLEMLIKECNNSVARNLVDIGFGYTQILPILTILWKVVMVDCVNGDDESYDFCKTHVVAIEQPELHLHPRFQGMFADMLALVIKTCKNEKKDVRVIIETHSEIIINRLGKLVASQNEDVEETDINIVIFNAINEGLDKYIIQTNYNSEGYLSDWPYGFFSDYVD